MIAKGTKSAYISSILLKIPLKSRKRVKEITLDMSNAMQLICRNCFPNAKLVTDRFHVQQIVNEGVQHIRTNLRHDAIKADNEKWKEARKNKTRFKPKIFSNGDTEKQLLARSRYLLFKPKSKWSDSQIIRAGILFENYPTLKNAYNLSMHFRWCYENTRAKKTARSRFVGWEKKVKECYLKNEKLEPIMTSSDTVVRHKKNILNYFNNRSTNASAESFNAKLKGLRSVVRGVRDKKFHLYRVAMLYG